ncbi:MAG: hypothetical protein CM1200mP14_13010 [Gammaproteobacteria bacterium]|nr:MAG: hypothetical protein CM1200mP14_13010 [Gammaproteobacteria bacterium]
MAPSGDRILFTSRTENRRNQQNRSEIQLLEVATGTMLQLTDNSAPEGRLSWAPDGRSFAYMLALMVNGSCFLIRYG